MLLSLLISLFYGESDKTAFLNSFAITAVTGFFTILLTRKANQKKLAKREGYIIVSSVWVVFSIFGALPYMLSGAIPSFANAFFETISGFTTTGSSILNNIEELPHGILFWRSLTQWLGGMGIIVMFLAILPLLGIGGRELFVAEVPGPVPDKLHPRIKNTARKLWGLYLMFTLAETLLLSLGGMSIFDSICHSFTTMATGGYSTKQASIGHYDSAYIHYIIILFMFIAGTNFTLSYAMISKKFSKVYKDEEFKFYGILTLAISVIIAIGLIISNYGNVEQSFRDSLFQVVSIITTTGFATSDYLLWPPILGLLIYMMMFVGGSAGSTGGGVKIVRVVIFLKNSFLEFKRLIHPNAIIPVRYNNNVVDPKIIANILAFIGVYVIIFLFSITIMSIWIPDFETSFSAVATTLGNIGPGFGKVGPMENFSSLADGAKYFLSFLMLVGRLELFTVLILFTPTFWKH